MSNIKWTRSIMLTTLILMGCSKDSVFSLSSEQQKYFQNPVVNQVKIDVLWLVDDSGSMETSQKNLTENFQTFIDKFQKSNFDYQMAVASTGAWKTLFDGDSSHSRFSDGTDATSHTNVHVIRPNTNNVAETFITNASLGVNGNADERGLQSLKAILENQDNIDDGFPRKNAKLIIIVLTDEDDFSHDGDENIQNWFPDPYANPVVHDTKIYVDYLKELTQSTDTKPNFLFNTIGILDEDCREKVAAEWGGRKIVRRYIDITKSTNGYLGSICDDFSDVMNGISDKIVAFTRSYVLSRVPDIDTIVVKVDGELIPQSATEGWTYDPTTNAIIFNGDGILKENSAIEIEFDPAGIRN